jgi:hypothetical protein
MSRDRKMSCNRRYAEDIKLCPCGLAEATYIHMVVARITPLRQSQIAQDQVLSCHALKSAAIARAEDFAAHAGLSPRCNGILRWDSSKGYVEVISKLVQ